jgi:hypothetical protein
MAEVKNEQPRKKEQVAKEPQPGEKQGQTKKKIQPIPSELEDQLKERELLPHRGKTKELPTRGLLQQPGPTKP